MLHENDIPVDRKDVLSDIEMGLSKNARLWPARRAPGQHRPHRGMAEAVLEHLELCGLRFRRRPPGPRHSTPPPYGDEGEGPGSERGGGAAPRDRRGSAGCGAA